MTLEEIEDDERVDLASAKYKGDRRTISAETFARAVEYYNIFAERAEKDADTILGPKLPFSKFSDAFIDLANECNNCLADDDPVTLAAMPYDLYLRTGHWQTMRRLARENAHERCEVCNASGQLDVHHRTYDRRGRERLSDLTVLCRNCHSKFHDKLPG